MNIPDRHKPSPANKWKYQLPLVFMGGSVSAYDDWRMTVMDEPNAKHPGMFVGRERAYDAEIFCGTQQFRYAGPYIESDGGHGMYGGLEAAWKTKKAIVASCFQRIEAATMCFFWIDPQSYGSLIEIGYALAQHKPIFVGLKAGSKQIHARNDQYDSWQIEKNEHIGGELWFMVEAVKREMGDLESVLETETPREAFELTALRFVRWQQRGAK